MGIVIGLQAEVKGKGNYAYQLDLNGVRSFEDFKKLVKSGLIEIALSEFEAEKRKGFDPKPRVRVDNSFSKSIKDVNPFGRIEFLARFSDIIQPFREAYDAIMDRSPEKSGFYKMAHLVYFNNRVVARDRREFLRFLERQQSIGFKNNDLISFVNIAPYARRLERYGIRRETQGRGKGRVTAKRKERGRDRTLVPNGTYVVSQPAIKRLLKGIALVSNVKFLPQEFKSTAGKTYRFKDGRPYLYPVIDCRISGAGLKENILQ